MQIKSELQQWCDKYGFIFETGYNGEYVIAAHPMGDDGEIDERETVEWISYNENTDSISYMNTDHNNMWLYSTRPDLDPDTIAEMLTEIAHILDWEDLSISHLVDPEDWQEIAQVNDAYRDNLYTSSLL